VEIIKEKSDSKREICEARIDRPWLRRLGGDQPTEADKVKRYILQSQFYYINFLLNNAYKYKKK